MGRRSRSKPLGTVPVTERVIYWLRCTCGFRWPTYNRNQPCPRCLAIPTVHGLELRREPAR